MVTTYAYSDQSPAEVKAGLLIVPVFEGPTPGPGVRETGLVKAYAAAKHTGKLGESLLVTRRDGDRFAADAVLLVGVGAKDEFALETARRVLGRAASTARRFGTVATTFPQAFGARRAVEAVQAAAEGLGLGAYRFDRYRSSTRGRPGPEEGRRAGRARAGRMRSRSRQRSSAPRSWSTRSVGRATS